ncbi:MAG: hypothetical protein MK208_19060 [Shimia sp.]|uniref:hypothetical protein n=1 Tax=Shimia sp. TaxID=1954381 RepID=UPI0025D9ABE7|nr:hypothetical protein [Shimia sp.]MCH2069344.1 hypothetical protein [Shimia sp.]
MPQRAPARDTALFQTGEQPRTLAALQAQAEVTFVEGGLDTVGLIGAQLSDALISTNNGAALLSSMGGLSRLQDITRPFHISRSRVTLRVNPTTQVQLARTAGRAGPDTVLLVTDPQDHVSLRIEANGGYDALVLPALDQDAQSDLTAAPTVEHTNIVSLAAVRQAKDRWARSDSGMHFNDILKDGGSTRLATLPHVGDGRAWQIQEQVIVSFLTYLIGRRISFSSLVAGCGFLQGVIFQDGDIRLLDKILLVNCDRRHFAVDLSKVASCWVSRFGAVSHLEFYAADGKAIAVLAPDPHNDLGHWNDLLASLPRHR